MDDNKSMAEVVAEVAATPGGVMPWRGYIITYVGTWDGLHWVSLTEDKETKNHG